MSSGHESAIDDAVIAAAANDYLDVWSITWLAETVVGDLPPTDLNNVALEAIRRLVGAGRLRAGHLVPPGEFVACPEGQEAALRKIAAALEDLDRRPDVAEIAYFELVTSDGGTK